MKIPGGVFSFVELEQFLGAFQAAGSDGERRSVYGETLRNLFKGSLKRDDFLRKLDETAKTLDPEQARDLATAAVYEAGEYTYDLIPGFREEGHVNRLVLWAAKRMRHDTRVEFLADCIGIASDDTLALRLLQLTNPRLDAGLEITYGQLAPAFMRRMRGLYGPDAPAETMDLSTSDPKAFLQWGMQSEEAGYDPEDRRIQRDFWLRRIGNSRKALADTFEQFLLPSSYHYPENPVPFVEDKLPLTDLAALFKNLPKAEVLDDKQIASLLRLEKLLAGEFRNGIPLNMDSG